MGRWMEVVREQPPEHQRLHTPEYERLVVGAIAPHPLLSAFHALESGSRAENVPVDGLSMLSRVKEHSRWYVNEDLWLPPDEVVQLLHQFRRFRRICQQQEFVPGLDGWKAAAIWRAGQVSKEFELWLDQIEALLCQAVEGTWWVRLML
jgi:hypothetical protein